ncbi:MAG: hypothetical protein ACM3XM_00765 [Mycobacterium leprae]
MPKLPIAVTGAALIGLAILLSLLPGFYGPGLLWSVLALTLGLVAVQQQLRLPQVTVPAVLDRPWIGPLFALVSTVLTWSLISLKIVPLLWLAGSACLIYDLWRRPDTDPSGFHYWFDWRKPWQGYRRLMLLGLAVMFVALLFTFSKGSSGFFMGGYDTNFSYTYGTTQTWNYLKSYIPGVISLSGRQLGFATVIQFVMAAMLLWTGFRDRPDAPKWLGMVPAAGAGLALLWWLVSPKSGTGSLLFLIGLIPVCGAAYFLYRGEGAGKWDGSKWLDRMPWPK